MKEYFLIAGTLLLGIYIGRMQTDRQMLKIYLSIIEEINSTERRKKSDNIFTSYNKKGCE